MIVALFGFRVRPEAHEELDQWVGRMAGLVHTMPGFITMDVYRSEDGRALAVPRFESEEALLAWRDHPEHRVAQQKGREEFFDDYWIDVCQTIRSYEFHRSEAGQHEAGEPVRTQP